jgi:MSHA biogenesis protein MshK
MAAELPYGLTDPTRPLEYTAASTPQHLQSDLVLTSVVISGETKTAVINGERLSEGQSVDGARIISIQPGRAILRKGNRTRELKVHQSNVRQLATKSSKRRPSL